MRHLVEVRLTRYFRKPLFWIAFVLCLGIGIICGIKCYQRLLDYDAYPILSFPMESSWIIAVLWIQTVLISLEIGRDFYEGTLRQKLIVGHTKTKLFLADAFAAIIVTFCLSVLALLPIGIGGYIFFTHIPTEYAVKWFLVVLLSMCAMSILPVMLSYLIGNRAIGVVASFCLMFCVCLADDYISGYYFWDTVVGNVGYKAYQEIVENGETRYEPYLSPNPSYLEGTEKTLVYTLYTLAPYCGIPDALDYCVVLHPEWEEKGADWPGYFAQVNQYRIFTQKRINMDLHTILGVYVLYTAAGVMLFRRKNIK